MTYEKDCKERIVDAFLAIFNVKGSKVTMDEVASSIHVSKKTVYKHFKNKEAIYEYVLKTAGDEIARKQAEIYSDDSLPLKEKIYRILTISIAKEKEIDFSKVSELAKDPRFKDMLAFAYEKRWQYFILLVEKGKEEGILKADCNASFITHLLSSGMEMLYQDDFLKENGLTYTEGIRMLADTVLSGIYQ